MLGIIGGTGLTQLANLEVTRREIVRTPWGEPSGALTFGRINGRDAIFLARHGYGHTIPPHMVNYRANIWALRSSGAKEIVSVAVNGRLTVTDSGTKLGACLAGFGIAQVIDLGLDPHVKNGALVELFPDWSDERFPLHVYYASRNHVPAKVRRFIDFILDSLSTATNAPRAVEIRDRGEGRQWRATG